MYLFQLPNFLEISLLFWIAVKLHLKHEGSECNETPDLCWFDPEINTYHEFYNVSFIAKQFDRNYGSAAQDYTDVVDSQKEISVHI